MLTGHKLLAINPRVSPYRVTVPEVCVSDGEVYRSMIRICVTETGTVSEATLLTPSAPFIEEQLPDAVRRWRFHPYLLDGRPTSFCYDLRYMVRGSSTRRPFTEQRPPRLQRSFWRVWSLREREPLDTCCDACVRHSLASGSIPLACTKESCELTRQDGLLQARNAPR